MSLIDEPRYQVCKKCAYLTLSNNFLHKCIGTLPEYTDDALVYCVLTSNHINIKLSSNLNRLKHTTVAKRLYPELYLEELDNAQSEIIQRFL